VRLRPVTSSKPSWGLSFTFAWRPSERRDEELSNRSEGAYLVLLLVVSDVERSDAACLFPRWITVKLGVMYVYADIRSCCCKPV
jgi:hypothetical protein